MARHLDGPALGRQRGLPGVEADRLAHMSEDDAGRPFEVAGRELGDFVSGWLQTVQREDAPSRGLLQHVGEDYDCGGHFLMANIAPEATDPAATDETLLLYAVMAAYQNDGFPGSGRWQGEEDHVRRAFEHSRALGSARVASNLLKRIAERSTRERNPDFERMLRRSMDNDAARIAGHDREMASINDRDIRAARLLDASLSVDQFILDIEP